jgi:hypothetical protein
MSWNSGERRFGSTAREAEREKFQAELLERFRRLMSRSEDEVVELRSRRVQVRESSTSSVLLESGSSCTSCQEISRRRSPGFSAKVKTAV